MELRLLAVVCIVGCFELIPSVVSKGAGRAFPVASENYIISNFKQINPSIEWDETNFLIDLSGHYANCEALKKPHGIITIDRKTGDGGSIGGIIDSIEGGETHVDATDNYINQLIRRWNAGQQYNGLIRRASRFGCSVRPGCDGYAVVACLFSPAQDEERPVRTTTTTTTTPRPRPITTTKQPTTTQPPTAGNLVRTERPLFSGVVRALAFTNEQYKVAEGIYAKTWDPSHYLENLSGYETDCSMIGTQSWPFDHTGKFNALYHSNVKGMYGYAMNRGSTPDALAEILPKFKQTIVQRNIKELGCSLIPDCILGASMYVVVSCLYE